MALNKILKFAAGVGALVQSQAAYDADGQRLIGNQPGLARPGFVNKALLQLSAVAAGVGEFLANLQAVDVEDTKTPAEISAMLVNAVANVAAAQLAASQIGHGKCYFDKSGANLVLLPLNGNGLIINGVYQTIPSGGVACAPTGLAAATVYFIFAYMVGAVMMLEASTTGHSTSATTGVEIKTGDATRTLVGMARTAGAATWSTVATEVLSWFNRKAKTVRGAFSVTRTTTSTVYVEINSEIRVNFLCFTGDLVKTKLQGCTRAGPGNNNFTDVGVDGTTAAAALGVGSLASAPSQAVNFPFSTEDLRSFSEGVTHYATLLGATDPAATGSWQVGAAPAYATTCSVTVMG